ncbi:MULTISPECIES: hypothetical protein [unclassified Xanthomonas]|nr:MULTISPECIES: hypothetical protein [unclassified Xanthomonas]
MIDDKAIELRCTQHADCDVVAMLSMRVLTSSDVFQLPRRSGRARHLIMR